VIAASYSSCHPSRSLLLVEQGHGVRESVAISYDLSALTLSVSHASRAWENHCGVLTHTLGYAFAYPYAR